MEHPLLLGGKRAGTLSETQSGLYTLYEARLENTQERLVRLWLHGKEGSAYLGLMEPEDGALVLKRRLTALERRGFPKEILCASDEEGFHNAIGKPAETRETQETVSLHNSRPVSDARSCPWPAPVPTEAGELLWLLCADGSLTAFDGVSNLIALPARLRRPIPGGVLRQIEGRDYLIFRR